MTRFVLDFVKTLNQTFWSKTHYSYDFKVKTHFNFVPCHFMENWFYCLIPISQLGRNLWPWDG